MDHLTLSTDFILALVAFIAGTIDTLAGGGGLITVPAILLTGMNPIMALGTSKLQGAICEFSACLHFLKKKQVNYKLLISAFVFTILGSALGTLVLQFIPIARLETLIPWLLLAVLLYYIWSQYYHVIFTNDVLQPDDKKFFLLGSSIGFYNGFFGPGTGSIWAIALMRSFRLNLQKATMYAKPLNMAGNLSALSIFIVGGHVNFTAALMMGVGSFLGGKLGANLVIYKEVSWLKRIFLSMMLISTAVTFYQYY